MGRYEQFIIKEEELILSQIQALSEQVIITQDSGMFQVLIDEEKSVVFIKKKSPYIAEIIDHHIIASNIKWKENFRSMLRKNKIKYKTKSLD